MRADKLYCKLNSDIHSFNKQIKQHLKIDINKKNEVRIIIDGNLITNAKLSKNFIKEISIGLNNTLC